MKGQVLLVYGTRTCLGNSSDGEIRRLSCRNDTLRAAHELGYDTVVFSSSQSCAPPATHADSTVTVDLRHPEKVVEAARRLHARQPLAAVLGCEEDALLSSAMIAEELGLPTHPPSAAFAAMDKPIMKEHFKAAGVPTADFTLARDEDDAVRWAAETGYPVVVKPCRSGASQGVIRADDEAELRAAYRRLRRIVRDYGLDHGDRPAATQLVERYVDGPEVSCELLLQDGVAQVFAVFEKPLPLSGPFFEETIYLTPPALSGDVQQEIERVSIMAARAIGLRHGPAHCELRLASNGPQVVEIAGRYLGAGCTWVFRDRLGQDIQPLFIKAALGEDVMLPEPLPDAPVTGAMILPVPGEGRIVAVHGADRAQRVPGIREVAMIACSGDVMVPFPEQTCYPIGFITAAGPTREAVLDSLAWAAGSISVELRPIGRDRWVRKLGPADADYIAPPGLTALTLAELDTAEAANLATSYLATAFYDELPPDEARNVAAGMVDDGAAGSSDAAWVFLEERAVSLGHVTGTQGIMNCFGVFPSYRGSELDEVVARLQLAEFARRGCAEAVCENDPRLPLVSQLLRGLGFTLQPTGPAPDEQVRMLSCSLDGLEKRRADAGTTAAPSASAALSGQNCCCECAS